MAYKPPQQQFSQFRQTLTFEDIVKQQITKCLAAISFNDLQASQASIRGLINLVTPKMSDTTYLEEMQGLDDDWQDTLKLKEREFKKKLRAAAGGCPDLVDKPSIMPDQQYWEDAFSICLALFERRGLLMKFAYEDPLT